MKTNHSFEGSARSTVLGFLVVLIIGLGLGLYLGQRSKSFKLSDLEKRFFPSEQPTEQVPPPPPQAPAPLPPLPQGTGEYEKAVIAAAARAMPAVVNVSFQRTVQVPMSPFLMDPFFRRFFGPGMPENPQKRREGGIGSGVIVSPDGYILTNNHVVAGADKVKVLLADQRQFDARIIGADPKTDVALIKIEATDLPTLPFGDSDRIEVGQSVLAVGNPMGLNQTVTLGIISAKGRARVGIADYEDFIQTDAAINPGNSGGALVDLRGELVGINTAIASRSGGNEGVGFAIPSNMAKMVMDSLLKQGKVVRGFLGVSLQELTPALARSFGLPDTRGALVADVVPGDPADQAGIKAGDVIVEMDGKPLEDMMHFRNQIAMTAPGTKVNLKIFRQGEYQDKTVTVGEMKEKEVAGAGPGPGSESEAPLGLRGQTLTPDLAQQFNLDPELRGVLITSVQPGSRGEEAGLAEGDVILNVNHQPVENVAELRQAYAEAKGGEILMVINRQGNNLFVAIPQE
jgi:serine protease Do